MKQPESFYCQDETQMLALGAKLARQLVPGQLIFLQGNLGAGKTTLVGGILRGLGYQLPVKSPTFTLVESYELAPLMLYHFDLYRLNNSQELDMIGFRDYLQPQNVCLIEWPEKAEDYLPPPDILIEISRDHNGRIVNITK